MLFWIRLEILDWGFSSKSHIHLQMYMLYRVSSRPGVLESYARSRRTYAAHNRHDPPAGIIIKHHSALL
jgi:hypothetical protein